MSLHGQLHASTPCLPHALHTRANRPSTHCLQVLPLALQRRQLAMKAEQGTQRPSRRMVKPPFLQLVHSPRPLHARQPFSMVCMLQGNSGQMGSTPSSRQAATLLAWLLGCSGLCMASTREPPCKQQGRQGKGPRKQAGWAGPPLHQSRPCTHTHHDSHAPDFSSRYTIP